MRRVLAALGFFLICLLCSIGCTSGGNCSSGGHCDCSGGDECFLDCNDDRCDQSCHNTGNLCGTVCGDNCTSRCHDVGNICSQSCGSGCALEGAHAPKCGVLCGDNCHLDCHDTSDCSARVGPNSEVSCKSVGACHVQCTGTCIVHCSNTGCDISCADNKAATECEPGRYACGGC